MHLGVFPRIYFAVYSDPSALPHYLSHRHAELCHRRYFQFQGLFTVSPMSLHLLMPFSIGALVCNQSIFQGSPLLKPLS